MEGYREAKPPGTPPPAAVTILALRQAPSPPWAGNDGIVEGKALHTSLSGATAASSAVNSLRKGVRK